MKKIFCILFLFSAIASSIFADKNRFYENGKVIDDNDDVIYYVSIAFCKWKHLKI